MPTMWKGKHREKTEEASSGSGSLTVVPAPPPPPAAAAAAAPASAMVPAGVEDPYSTSGDLGIRIVANPPNAEFDVCFVHGLTGNRESTWTHSNGTFWPSLLGEVFPIGRVMVYGYDADVIGLWTNASSENLRSYGNTLAMSIVNVRPNESTRPIYFVAHSLGGLVVEAAVLASQQPNEPRLNTLPSCIAGIIFMGTPHSGSYLAQWGWPLARFLNVIWRSNHKVLETLKSNSDFLKQVEQDFQRQLLHKHKHIKVFCFFEAVAINGVGFVVPEESASLPAYTSCGIHANHMDMTKFSSMRDAGILLVIGELRDWVSQLDTETQTGAKTAADTGPGAAAAAYPKQKTKTEESVAKTGHTFTGTVTAEKVIMGDIRAERDLTFNF